MSVRDDLVRPGRMLRRAGRRTNVALLTLLVGAFASGWLSFAVAQPVPAQLMTLAHGLMGLGVIALAPWKVVVVRRAPALRIASLVLVGVVVVCLAAGFVEVFGGFGVVTVFGGLGLSPIQVHVGAAFVLVPLVAWHVLRHRRMKVRPVDVSRRNLVRTGGFVLAAGAGWVGLEGVGALVGSPSASRVATGSHRLDAADIPATIWLLDRVPTLDPSTYVVSVGGAEISFGDLDAAGEEVPARLDCTSGWYAEATWTGVALSSFFDPEALTQARSITVTSTTGYYRRFPVADAPRLWLATRVEGQLLRPGTGAPVRLVAPGRRGFWWVKWVASVELNTVPAFAQSPFPLQ